MKKTEKTSNYTSYSLKDASKSPHLSTWSPHAAIVEKLLYLYKSEDEDEKHLLSLDILDPARISFRGQMISLPSYRITEENIEVRINYCSIDDEESAKLHNRVIFQNSSQKLLKTPPVLEDKVIFKAALKNYFIASYFNDGGCEARAFFTSELLIATGFDKKRISYCYIWNNNKNEESLFYRNHYGNTDYYSWHVAVCIDKTFIIDPTVNKSALITIKTWCEHFNFYNEGVFNFDPEKKIIECDIAVEKNKKYLIFLPFGFSAHGLLKKNNAFKIIDFLKNDNAFKNYFYSMLGSIHSCKHKMFKNYFNPLEGPFREVTKNLSPINLEIATCKHIASNLVEPNQKLVSTKTFFLAIAIKYSLRRLSSLLLQDTKNTIDPLLSRKNNTLFTAPPELENKEDYKDYESPSDFSYESDSDTAPRSERGLKTGTSDTLDLESASDSTLNTHSALNSSTPQ